MNDYYLKFMRNNSKHFGSNELYEMAIFFSSTFPTTHTLFYLQYIQWIAAQRNSTNNNIKNQYNNRPNQSVVHGKWEKPRSVCLYKSRRSILESCEISRAMEILTKPCWRGTQRRSVVHSVENKQCCCCCCFCCCWMCVRHWIVSFVRCLRIGLHKHAAAAAVAVALWLMFVFVFVVGVVVVIRCCCCRCRTVCVAFQCCWCSFTTQTSAPVWMREISQQHAHIYRILYTHMYAQ